MALSEQKNYWQVELEALQFRVDYLAPILEDISCKIKLDDILREKIFELRRKVWAECLQTESKTVTHEFFSPRTWWQHFKKEKFPKWLLKKYPVDFEKEVQRKKVTFRRYAKFPSFNYKSDKRFEKFVIEEFMEISSL